MADEALEEILKRNSVAPLELANHMFLFKKLPSSQEQNIQNIEQALLEALNHSVKQILLQVPVPNIKSVFESWVTIQADPLRLQNALQKLGIGESSCLFVKKQNCTILLTKLDETRMRVVTFRSSLPNEHITGTCGSLRIKYPETVDIVPISSLLLSDCFTRQVNDLVRNTYEIAMPTTATKNGEVQVDHDEPSYPFMVSEFLVGILCPMNTEELGSVQDIREKIQVEKKLRDQLNGMKHAVPFRRSGLWMSVKVVLQMIVQEELETKTDGYVLYKICIAQMLSKMAEEYVHKKSDMAWDIAAQMMVKLARRTKKLSEVTPASTDNLEKLRERTIKQVAAVVGKLHKICEEQWDNESSKTSTQSSLPIQKITQEDRDWMADCLHYIPELIEYISSDLEPSSSESTFNLNMIDPISPSVTLSDLLKRCKELTTSEDFSLNDQSVWIHQVERFARHDLERNEPCEDIFSLTIAYAKTVANRYGISYSDPIHYSRIIVTVLKFISVIDEIATEKFPLIKEYSTGITRNMFECLLLPEKQDMELLQDLQKYFESRNNEAVHKSWIWNGEISESAFSVRYAEGDSSMTSLRNEILKDADNDIEKKKKEVEVAKVECQKLKEHYASFKECDQYTNWRGWTHHDRYCRRCDVKKRLDIKRKSVRSFQHPLPVEEYLQFAAVFELLVPHEIACIRDSISVFVGEIYDRNHFKPRRSTHSWADFRQLASYRKSEYKSISQLVSQSVDVHSTNSWRCCPDVVDEPATAFIIRNNEMNCVYDQEYILNLSQKTPSNLCTFQIQNTNAAEAANYRSLQWSLESKRATENEVISRQHQCHENLSLREFICFGSIRCGHRIQIRNLYAAMASQTLSLDKEPVVALIIQSLWEMGPGNRDIHVDLESLEHAKFSCGFLSLLETILDENATNWGSPLVLLSAILTALRILELSQSIDVKEHAAIILQKYRKVIDGWCVKLENLVSEHCESNPVQSQLMSELLLKSVICSAFTYNASSAEILPYILRNDKDITNWLKTLHRLHHAVTHGNIPSNTEFSPFLKNLLRHATQVIPLNLEDYLHNRFRINCKSQSVHDFVSSKWHDAEEFTNSIPAFSNQHGPNNKRHVYIAKYPNGHHVCIDILQGTFLVDGFPPSVLPERIVKNEIFRSFFKTSQFRVQRDSKKFSTLDKYCGSHFEFSQVGDRLIIRQMLKGYWLELLPRELFKEKVPHDLVDNYTQWVHSNFKSVYFRRSSVSTEQQQNFDGDADYILVRILTDDVTNSNEWFLRKYIGPNAISSCHFLSIDSPGFKKISGNLGKLENKDFIHVYLDKRELKISANVWRFNLSFSLDRVDGRLHCDNYPDYYISPEQNLGTLVGLQSGIVFEKKTVAEPTGKKKMLVIQHGTVVISKNRGTQHQAVVVTGAGVRNPHFFVYEVDDLLKRLRPGDNKSAWLYLALLHAVTSAPFRDPFTELTGTEMAIWMLQSGFAWSGSPYDPECLKTLKQISGLSPKYVYYPEDKKVMQTVQWPNGLANNSYAAYDGYAVIAQKLLEDCMRLDGMFTEDTVKVDTLSDLTLCKRSYYRNINFYNKAAHLSPDIIQDASALVQLATLTLPSSKKDEAANRSLYEFSQYRLKQVLAPCNKTVADLIMKSEPIQPNTKDILSKGILSTWLNTNCRINWLQLYTLAIESASENIEHELTLILGAMLYSGQGSLQQLLNLHNIALLNSGSQNPKFPSPVESLTNDDYIPCKHEFVGSTIIECLAKGVDPPPLRKDFKTDKEHKEASEKYTTTLQEKFRAATETIRRNHWPGGTIDSDSLKSTLTQHGLTNFSNAMFTEVSQNLRQWRNNRNLREFIAKVDALLGKKSVIEKLIIPDAPTCRNLDFKSVPYTVDNYADQLVIAHDEMQTEMYTLAKQVFRTGHLPASVSTPRAAYNKCCTIKFLFQKSRACINLTSKIANELDNSIQNAISRYPADAALEAAGILIRTAPVILIRDQFGKQAGNAYIDALVVLWAHQKRINRLLLYFRDTEKYSVELARELESQQCENWNPHENPEWLLIELELDLTIRPIQVQVARQMIKMPGDKNGVMQLNMGEGKTAVIMPMIVATLSSRQNCLCRVTVLNSIYATNFNLLAAAIGGFLNKRLYAVPCSRDLDIGKYLDQIQLVYEECMRLGGALMTLPEHRLSFRLQMYNNYLQNGKEDIASKIYGIESWLRKHARDLVDESDEIFSVKYQLIYTTGKQEWLDGENGMRWKVCQKIFDFLPKVAAQLYAKYQSKVIEFEPKEALKSPEIFTNFRILSDECKHDFSNLIANMIVDGEIPLVGRLLRVEEKAIITEFLTSENISEENHNKFFMIEDIAPEKRQSLLLASGYLRRGILFAALKKRWRVEYGVKIPKTGSPSKLMAVPFRAKDVAAERTEFGHPDMAIVLTQLSYYYSGLSDQQLFQCFDLLDGGISEPETIYNSWINRFPSGNHISDTIKSYKGVNLKDYQQRTEHLFPMLKHNKAVIDFWLENVAFPAECRQFPGKIVTNAWDLCYKRNAHATTGFSGTNDTSLLLPAQITQQDLAILEETNAKMEDILKGAENTWKKSLDMGVSCKTILQLVTQDDLRVLIDCGALMLELENEGIAELWLQVDKNLEAVVYFGKNGQMMIKIRQNISNRLSKMHDQHLSLSPFKDRLENCAIYLDDQHARGTDIKLPTNFKACVTVGSGMRRDKLIQACMRMRKLGKGQSVHFYLSHEVNNKIRLGIEQSRDINVSDIINWTKENSYKFEKDGLVYWATNARNYAKNLAADDLFDISAKSQNDGKILATRVQDPDAQTLEVLYGTYHQRMLVIVSVPMWFLDIPNKLSNCDEKCFSIPNTVHQMLQGISVKVMQKCMKHIPDQVLFRTMLDEEQEKELEPEQEAQREISRPRMVKALEPKLHPNVRRVVTTLQEPSIVDGISRLCDIFKDTTIGTEIQADGWGDRWFATDDFINVVELDNSDDESKNNSFLRPIRFFVSFQNGPNDKILLLSLHEVNCLISDFRNRSPTGATLHTFSGRWMEGKPIFANEPYLQITRGGSMLSRSLDENCLAPLLIAAGNLFFESKAEQTAFARFLGLRLKPWTDDEENAFHEKLITNSGFALPISPGSLREGCNFEKDPTGMVREILKIRNYALRETDHAVSILDSFHHNQSHADVEKEVNMDEE